MRRSFTSRAARSLRTALADCPYGALDDCLVVIPLGSSSMDQYRDLAMREYLDRLAAEDEGGDAVRPCEAMTIRSQPFETAVSMIAW